MRLSVISFTQNGMLLSKRIAQEVSEYEMQLYTKYNHNSPWFVEESLCDWTKGQMADKNAILFIGACGIAVRAIAPHLTDKLHDSPVLVMDEKGAYVIPILSGHVGGANEIAWQIAAKTGAVPVITTATDINGRFAVDVFAKKNGLHIANKDGIAKVSAKVLAEKEITISIEPGHLHDEEKIPESIRIVSYPPPQFVDVVISTEETEFDTALCLKPKEYVLGMGCKRGKEPEKIDDFIRRSLKEHHICKEQIMALSSIEQKKDEKAFLAWSSKENIPFLTFSAEELQNVEGEFQASAFVKEQVGVDNVCERAALAACAHGGRLICEKCAEDGMTIAIAKREWSVVFDAE